MQFDAIGFDLHLLMWLKCADTRCLPVELPVLSPLSVALSALSVSLLNCLLGMFCLSNCLFYVSVLESPTLSLKCNCIDTVRAPLKAN